MNCDGYSCSALMGNWMEERMAFKQPYRLQQGAKIHRESSDITYVSNQNQLKNLTRISRVPHWDTRGVILNQGFNEKTSEFKDEYNENVLTDFHTKGDLRPLRKTASVEPNARDKTWHSHTSGAKNYKIMGESNADQQYVKRPYKSSVTDFGSTLRNHPDEHGKLFDLTMYQSAFSRNKQPDPATDIMAERDLRERPAGSRREAELKLGGIKMTSVLSGEQYRDYEDPQHNTHCQRTWVYGGDASLARTDKSLRQTLENLGGQATPASIIDNYRQARNPKARLGDGPTTLPLENGERAFFPLLNHNGSYRRQRSDVTRIANEPMNFR